MGTDSDAGFPEDEYVLLCVVAHRSVSMTETPLIPRPDAPSFSVAVLPGRQRYAKRNSAAFLIQTRWLAEQWAAGDVSFVVHESDVLNAPEPDQLDRADRALGHLDDGVLKRDATSFEDRVPESRFSDRPWWGDSFDGTVYSAYARWTASTSCSPWNRSRASQSSSGPMADRVAAPGSSAAVTGGAGR